MEIASFEYDEVVVIVSSKLPKIAALQVCCLLAVSVALLLFANDAIAVVIDAGDGSGNTTAPDDDPGFSNIGRRGEASAVYLGNRWAVTASHVGAGAVELGGVEYAHIPSQTVRLENPEGSGLSEFADVVLFRLAEDPVLPSLRLPCTQINIGTEVTLIGGGHDREPELGFWEVDVITGDNNDVWTQVDSESASDRQGYLTLEEQTIRWGNSLATLTNFDIDSGFGDVLSFQSSFDQILDVSDLGQGVRGDSGGAAFQKNQGVWELVGVIHAVGLLDNQPGGTRAAFYGGDTFMADLFRYSDEIRSKISFEPDVGDANADGVLDGYDLDAMIQLVGEGRRSACHFDLDSNNSINDADLSLLLEATGTLLGDANLDGSVGFSDFLIVSRAFGTAVGGWGNGDFDGDGEVTFADFLTLSESFGQSASAAAPVANAVPEPNGNSLFLLVIFFALSRHVRRSL